jgi:hypothetical protein
MSGNQYELHAGLITNCVVNGIMLLVVSIYFLMVYRHIKLNSNLFTKIFVAVVSTALILRFFLALYDCFVDLKIVADQKW